MPQTAKILIISGIILVIAGVIIWLAGDKLSWFGNLPGDIKIEKENVKFYFPLTTMIILSAGLSLILWIIRKII